MRTRFEAILFSLVVVRDGDRYLLIAERGEDGGIVWYLPAGGVKAGEDLLTAATRETLEESGLLVDPIGILGADQSRCGGWQNDEDTHVLPWEGCGRLPKVRAR